MDQDPNQPLLPLLSDEVTAVMVAAGRSNQFEDGRLIHSRGGGRPGLSVILSGRVKFGVYRENGTYIQTGALGEGHCFGEATLFANKPRAYDAEAMGQTTILDISKPRFNALFDQYPEFARALLITLTTRLYDALDFADDLRGLALEVRVAKHLVRIINSGGMIDDAIPMRQVDLAYALGISRVSVGKALDTLQDHHLITLGYGEIKILNPTLLANWDAPV